MNKIFWLFKMAWRDSRRSRSRLFLFTSSIVLGIAALVAINSFGENLRSNIESEAKTLLGADLKIEANRGISDTAQLVLDGIEGGNQSIESNFSSMVLFPKTGGTRLLQIKALEGDFPYYGKLVTEPQSAEGEFRDKAMALVDKDVMEQFGVVVGDTVKVGEVAFVIGGRLMSVPGRASFVSSMAPVVYIARQYMDDTGLIQKGSRVSTRYFYEFNDNRNVEELAQKIRSTLRKERIDVDTVESSKENIGEAFSNMNSFLNLVGFIALLLGCIGVASAVHIYVKEKLATVAILRCIGVQGRDAFLIYLIQILAMGFIGSLVGAVLGSLVQQLFPLVWQDFLPFEVVLELSSTSILQGLVTGVAISLLFAMLPLLTIRQVSPLNAIRSISTSKQQFDPLRWVVILGVILFITGFAYLQIGSLLESVAFTVFIGMAFLLLGLMAKLLMWSVRRFFPVSWSYMWRQSLANLYRPNNQTLILLVSVGLGTMLISFLFFTQGMLLGQLQISSGEGQPNVVVFDIQTSQKEGVAQLARDYKLPVLQQVPIVAMRLSAINGLDKKAYEADSTKHVPRWAFNRENRVTYRDTLIGTEEISSGEWLGTAPVEGLIPVSVDERYAGALRLKLGDELTFNVQGVPMETVISSVRKVAWNRIQTNFMIVFPNGVLEEAPQFHVLISRTNDKAKANEFKTALVSEYPNVSLIDLTLILRTIDEILGKVSFVITFMALFSIATGLLVLIGSVIISKYQRIRESVLLRTLGASRRQILLITALEYAFLGFLAALTGIMLSLLGAVISSRVLFEVVFVPPLLPAFLIILSITILTVIIGLSNVRGILGQPPLEVLRSEV